MPNLSMNATFTYFTGVAALSPGQPVFLITDEDDGSCLVIKRDAMNYGGGNHSVTHNLEMMKRVNPGTTGKVMAPPEVQAITEHLEFTQRFAAAYNQSEPTGAVALRQAVNRNGVGVWYKMAKAEGVLGLNTASAQLQQNDKSGVRAIAKALNDSGGLEALGKIVAVDMYNGNQDRFTFSENNGGWNPLANENFRVLINPGNVIVAVDRSKVKPIGLDAWDPANRFGDVTLTVQQIERPKLAWTGRKLAPDQKAYRRRLTEDVVYDLEQLLGPRSRKVSFLRKKRLAWNAASRVYDGIKQGTKTIKARLNELIDRKQDPGGLKSRLDILNGPW